MKLTSIFTLTLVVLMAVSFAGGLYAEDTKPAVAVKTKAPAPVKFADEMDKVSYAIGMQIGRQFTSQGLDIDVALLTRGIKDVLEGAEPALTPAEIGEVMAAFSAKMAEKNKAAAGKDLEEGKAFLAGNAKKEGVVVLDSGLQYKVITEGTGKSPKATDRVKTHYRGTLINGEEFDSSYKRGQPAEFPVNGVIKGWTEALQLMKEGSKWQLFIPSDLAYGERGNPRIPANSTLVFEVELIEVLGN